jgi:hypothetical protein
MTDHIQAQHDSLSLADSWPTIFEHMRAVFSPIGMALADVALKKSYRFNFKAQLKNFITAAQVANRRLGDGTVIDTDIDRLVDRVVRAGIGGWEDPNLQLLSITTGLEQAAILYALICVEQTVFGGEGGMIRVRLMRGKNNEGNTDFLQSKTDEEYFDYMENNYKNFCIVSDLLKPKKSEQIKIVAGYLILG